MYLKFYGNDNVAKFTNLLWEVPKWIEEVTPFDMSLTMQSLTIKLPLDYSLWLNPGVYNAVDSNAGQHYILKDEVRLDDASPGDSNYNVRPLQNLERTELFDGNDNLLFYGTFDQTDPVILDFEGGFAELNLISPLAALLDSKIVLGQIGSMDSSSSGIIGRGTTFEDCVNAFMSQFLPGFTLQWPQFDQMTNRFIYRPLDSWAFQALEVTDQHFTYVVNNWATRYSFDFSGATIGEALKELALLAGCHIVAAGTQIRFVLTKHYIPYGSWGIWTGNWPELLQIYDNNLTVTKIEYLREEFRADDLQFLTGFRYKTTILGDFATQNAAWAQEVLTPYVDGFNNLLTIKYTLQGVADPQSVLPLRVGSLFKNIDPRNSQAVARITKVEKDLIADSNQSVPVTVEAYLETFNNVWGT